MQLIRVWLQILRIKIDRTGLFGYKAWSNSGPNCKSDVDSLHCPFFFPSSLNGAVKKTTTKNTKTTRQKRIKASFVLHAPLSLSAWTMVPYYTLRNLIHSLSFNPFHLTLIFVSIIIPLQLPISNSLI